MYRVFGREFSLNEYSELLKYSFDNNISIEASILMLYGD